MAGALKVEGRCWLYRWAVGPTGPRGRARRRARARGFGVAPVPWTPPPVPPAPGVRDGRGGAPVAPRRDPRGRLAGELRHRGPAPAVRGRGGALPEGERRVRRVRRGLQDVHGVRRRAEQPVPLRRVRGVRRSRERRVQRRLPGLRRGSARRERGGRLRRVPRPRRRGVLARGRARFAPRRVRRVRRHSEQRQRAGRLRRLRAGLGCEPDDPTKRSWCCDCAETAFGTHVVDFCCACVDRASHWHALSGGAAEGPPAAHALAEDLWRQGRDALAEQSAAATAFRDARDESRARGVADGTVQPGDLTYARSFSLFELGERARAAFVAGWDIMRDAARSDDMSQCYAETYVFGNRTNPRDACARVRRRQRDVRGVRGRRLRSGRGARSGRLRFVRRGTKRTSTCATCASGTTRPASGATACPGRARRSTGAWEHGSAVPELPRGDRASPAPGARTRRRSAPPATRARAGAAGATACPTRARPGTGAASARCGTTRPRTRR